MSIKTNKIEAFRSFTKSAPSRVIAVVMMLVIFATSVFAAFTASYTVTIVDDGTASPITTTRTEPIEILSQASITLDTSDKIDLSAFESGKGGKIVVVRAKEISVDYCGTLSNYQVYATNVTDAIKEVGIALTDGCEVNYKLMDKVVDGMIVSVVIPNPVTINLDGYSKAAVATENTVAEFLAAQAITLGEHDVVSPALNTSVTAGLNITVKRVAYTEITEVQGIPFRTVTKRNTTLPAGTQQEEVAGVNGEQAARFLIRLEDGIETERAHLSTAVTTPAVTRVVINGSQSTAAPVSTQPSAPAPVSNPGRSYNGVFEGQVIGGKATHYCACSTCNGSNAGSTASGIRIYNGMVNPYIVACNWLPLGTKLKVNGVMYTVADRGGSGFNSVGRLDVFTPGGHAECYRLGSPRITIEIVQLSRTN